MASKIKMGDPRKNIFSKLAVGKIKLRNYGLDLSCRVAEYMEPSRVHLVDWLGNGVYPAYIVVLIIWPVTIGAIWGGLEGT